MESLLIFDLKGPFAHFRSFYTNSSSLSYCCPPRTVVMGIVGGILGLEKDSYYEDFSCERCKIAVSLRLPLRKVMQTVNYVNTKQSEGGERAVNLSAGRTQIPLEIILPPPGNAFLVYRIFFHHPAFEARLRELLREGKAVFPPYLGVTEFIAKAEFVDFIEGENIRESNSDFQYVEIHSVLPVSKLEREGLLLEEGKQYIKELMPVEFNSQREARTANFFYERKGESVKARLRGKYHQITYKEPPSNREIKENIVFME